MTHMACFLAKNTSSRHPLAKVCAHQTSRGQDRSLGSALRRPRPSFEEVILLYKEEQDSMLRSRPQ